MLASSFLVLLATHRFSYLSPPLPSVPPFLHHCFPPPLLLFARLQLHQATISGFINVVSPTRKHVKAIAITLLGRHRLAFESGVMWEDDTFMRKELIVGGEERGGIWLEKGVNTYVAAQVWSHAIQRSVRFWGRADWIVFVLLLLGFKTAGSSASRSRPTVRCMTFPRADGQSIRSQAPSSGVGRSCPKTSAIRNLA